ncbi:hypothetical protein [Pacificispira sp.]|uniref:hypothetical protein n=1 Tax=Pacificispira sp. TaxID=2888761 RepID=UPI003BAA0A95
MGKEPSDKPSIEVSAIREPTPEEWEQGRRFLEQETEAEKDADEALQLAVQSLQSDIAEDARRAMRNLTVSSLTVILLRYTGWPMNQLNLLGIALPKEHLSTYQILMLVGVSYFMVGFVVRYLRSFMFRYYTRNLTKTGVAIAFYDIAPISTVNKIFFYLRRLDALVAFLTGAYAIWILGYAIS